MKINLISKLKVRKADEKIDWQKLFEINQCVEFKLFEYICIVQLLQHI